MTHKSRFNFVEQVIVGGEGETSSLYKDPDVIIDEYSKLNEKCDFVIAKIKARRKNKKITSKN